VLSQSLRDPAGPGTGMPEPGPADADWMLRPPRRMVRRLDRLRQRVPVRVRRTASGTVPLLAFVLLALWVVTRFWLYPDRVSPLHPAQQAAARQLLDQVAHALVHLHDPFAGLPQVVGGGALVAVPLAPVTLAFGSGVGYALWLTLGLAGSAATAYWALFRHLVGSRMAAFIGALMFGFAPGVLWHANGQPAFVTNLLIPVIVVWTVRLGRGRWLRDGVLLGVLVAAQALVNAELLAITALAGGYAALCYLVQRGSPEPAGFARLWPPRPPSTAAGRSRFAGLAVAVGTGLVLLVYPLLAGLPRQPVPDARLGEDATTIALYWRDTLAGNFTADRSVGGIEQNTWFGWPLLILAGVCLALLWRQSVAVRVVALTALVFGVLGLGAQVRLNGRPTPVPGPWWVLSKVPGLDLIAPSRLALVLVPCLAIVLAVAYDRLPSGEPVAYGLTGRRVWIVFLAVALTPNLPRPLQADPRPAAAPRAMVVSGTVPVPVPAHVRKVG